MNLLNYSGLVRIGRGGVEDKWPLIARMLGLGHTVDLPGW